MEQAKLKLLLAAGLLSTGLAACGDDAPAPAPRPKVAPPAAPAAPAAEAKPDPTQPKPAAADSADRSLAARVKEALLAEKGLNAHGIEVEAKNGVVTLFGTVANKSGLDRAVRVASGTEGARSVENKLVV